MTTAKNSEEMAERKLRREALLKYGPIFAPALRFSFDRPEDHPEVVVTREERKARKEN
jgi:hypothetical protein